MYSISTKQIKAARALLDWSQDDLAAFANLSPTTISNLESGAMSPRGATMNTIRLIMENFGIEFTDGEGVKRRNDEIKVYQGRDSSDEFFNDMLQAIKEKDGEIVSVFKSQETLIEVCAMKRSKMGRLEQIAKFANIKCLLPSALEPTLLTPSFQFRTILKQHIGAVSYFVYGNKYAIILAEANSTFRFVTFNSLSLAQDYKEHFFVLWEMAPPIFAELKRHDERLGA